MPSTLGLSQLGQQEEEQDPLQQLLEALVQQAQNVPLQPPQPPPKLGFFDRLTLGMSALNPQTRQSFTAPVLQERAEQRQAYEQYNPELERLKLMLNVLGGLGPILNAQLRAKTPDFTQFSETIEEPSGKRGIYRYTTTESGKPVSKMRLGDAPGRQALPRTVYDPTGRAFSWNPETGATEPITLPSGGQAARPISPVVTQRVSNLQSLRSKAETLNSRLARVFQDVGARGRIAAQVAQNIPLGPTVTGYIAPETQSIVADLKDLNDFLLRMRSGAQINEQEYARLSSTMPQIGDNPQVAASKMARFFSELDVIAQTYEQTQPVQGINLRGEQETDPVEDLLREAREGQ